MLIVASAAMISGCTSSHEAIPPDRVRAYRDNKTVIRDSSAQAAHDAAVQHFVDGSIYEMRNEYAQAVLEYQDALRYEKDHAVYFALSKCYSHLGKHTLAIETGKEAVRLAPDKLDYRRSLANSYIAAYELDAAALEYEEIVKRDSNAID